MLPRKRIRAVAGYGSGDLLCSGMVAYFSPEYSATTHLVNNNTSNEGSYDSSYVVIIIHLFSFNQKNRGHWDDRGFCFNMMLYAEFYLS